MPTLIANLSTGKGTWSELTQILKHDWDKIILITNEFGKENFKTAPKNTEFIIINTSKTATEIKQELIRHLKPKLKTDIALNITSGTGKEHTALISALLNLGVSIKLITLENNQITEV